MSLPKPNSLLRSSAALRGARNVTVASSSNHHQSGRNRNRRYAHSISSSSSSNPILIDESSSSSCSSPPVLGCAPPVGSVAHAIAIAAHQSGNPNGGTSNYTQSNQHQNAISSSSSLSPPNSPCASSSNPSSSNPSSSSSSSLVQRSQPGALILPYSNPHRSKSQHHQRHARTLHFWSPTNGSSSITHNNPASTSTATSASHHTHTVNHSNFEDFIESNGFSLPELMNGGSGVGNGGNAAEPSPSWFNPGAGKAGGDSYGSSSYGQTGAGKIDQKDGGNQDFSSLFGSEASSSNAGPPLPPSLSSENGSSFSDSSNLNLDLFGSLTKASTVPNPDSNPSPSFTASHSISSSTTTTITSTAPPAPPSQSNSTTLILSPTNSQPTSNQQQPTNQPYMTRAPSFLPPYHISASSSSSSSVNNSPGLPPHWARTFSLPPRHPRGPAFCFEHGAYGIPKRHPLAALPSSSKGKAKRTNNNQSSGGTTAVGMLAAAADFLTGPQTPVESLRESDRPSRGSGGTRGKAGPSESIRENGRIVPDRLASVSVGEDAYFLRPDSIGVADGVGGWASRPGANPALYSRLLMHFCSVELSRFDNLSASDLAANGGAALSRWESLDPVEVMHRAWERCVRASRREGILGSSTALLAVLRGDELRIANLGDCVLLIIRAGDLFFRSTEQQHSFNFPVQLGMMGSTAESVKLDAKEMEAKIRNAKEEKDLLDVDEPPVYAPFQNQKLNVNGHLPTSTNGQSDTSSSTSTSKPTSAATDYANSPVGSSLPTSPVDAEWDEPRRDAGRWTVKVQRGDIIILGSDGLVDNLFDEDILEEVCRFAPPPEDHLDSASSNSDFSENINNSASSSSKKETILPPDFSPQLVSEALCSRAKAVSEDSRAVASPFQQRAMEEGLHYVGGKHDDISVLVAVVGERDLPASTEDSTSSTSTSSSSSASSTSSSSEASSHPSTSASFTTPNFALGGYSSSSTTKSSS